MAKQEVVEQRYCENCKAVVNAHRVRSLGSAPWRCDVCRARTDPLGPLAQPTAGVAPLPPAQTGTKPCPYCAEDIQAAATKCRYCGSWLSATPQQPPQMPGYAPSPQVVVQERKGAGPVAAGFGGCLGVVLAIVFLIVLLAVCGQVGTQ